jgi:hypothetical protein
VGTGGGRRGASGGARHGLWAAGGAARCTGVGRRRGKGGAAAGEVRAVGAVREARCGRPAWCKRAGTARAQAASGRGVVGGTKKFDSVPASILLLAQSLQFW